MWASLSSVVKYASAPPGQIVADDAVPFRLTLKAPEARKLGTPSALTLTAIEATTGEHVGSLQLAIPPLQPRQPHFVRDEIALTAAVPGRRVIEAPLRSTADYSAPPWSRKSCSTSAWAASRGKFAQISNPALAASRGVSPRLSLAFTAAPRWSSTSAAATSP